MKYQDLEKRISTPVFTMIQAQRVFTEETANGLRIQLARWVQRGLLLRLKRGLFQFSHRAADELVLAAALYQPSYISLETALSVYGLIPDVPAEITSVTSVTSNMFVVLNKRYRFSRIQPRLFFGFETKLDEISGLYYQLAQPEKAVLDWIYLRRITRLTDMRLATEDLNQQRLSEYGVHYPCWVRKVIDEQFSFGV